MEKIFSEPALKWINEWSAMLFHMNANTFCLQRYTNVQYKHLILYVQKSVKCFASSVCVECISNDWFDLIWSVMIKNSSRFFTFKTTFFLNRCCFFSMIIFYLRCFIKIAATFFCLFVQHWFVVQQYYVIRKEIAWKGAILYESVCS